MVNFRLREQVTNDGAGTDRLIAAEANNYAGEATPHASSNSPISLASEYTSWSL